MSIATSKSGWIFGIIWTLVMAIGWTVGGYIGLIADGLFYLPIFAFSDSSVLYGTILLLVFSVITLMLYGSSLAGSIGLLQWILLRNRINLSPRWIIQSALAGGFGQIIGSATVLILALAALAILLWLPEAKSFIWEFLYALRIPVILLGVGTILGGRQYFILKQYVSRADQWVGANAIGWLLGGLIQSNINHLVNFAPTGLDSRLGMTTLTASIKSLGWAENLIGGCTFGLITGFCLVGLLRSNHRWSD